jgi:hypothetical protein
MARLDTPPSKRMVAIGGRISYSREDQESVSHALDESYTPWRRGKPTQAEPGSTEKIEILAKRLREGMELFVPGDKQHVHTIQEPPEWRRGYRGEKGDPSVSNLTLRV